MRPSGVSNRLHPPPSHTPSQSASALSNVPSSELSAWPSRMPQLGNRGGVGGGAGGGGGGTGGAMGMMGGMGMSAGSGGLYLASLNPWQVGWQVTVRVFSQSEMRQYSNERGSGQVCSLQLIDPSGSMKMVAFGETADRLYNDVHVGRVYRLSGAQVRRARQNEFETNMSEHEMSANTDTQFLEMPDDGSMPQHTLRFQPLAHIPSLMASAQTESGGMGMSMGMNRQAVCNNIDVIGIIIEAQPQQEVMSKRQQPLLKRDITILDSSATAVKMTVWGAQPNVNELQLRPVVLPDDPRQDGKVECNIVVVSNARVSDYGGCSLSTTFSSTLFPNPPWSETHELIKWFRTKGVKMLRKQEINMITTGRQNEGGIHLDSYAPATIAELLQIKSQYQNQPLPQPILARLTATLSFVRQGASDKPPWYMSCPTEGCKKKLIPLDGGIYQCDKCQQQTSTVMYRYLLSIIIQDETGSMWVTAFDKEAEKIMGKTADEMQRMLAQHDVSAYKSQFELSQGHVFTFFIKGLSKMDASSQVEREEKGREEKRRATC